MSYCRPQYLFPQACRRQNRTTTMNLMSDHSSETKQTSADQYPPTELSQTLNRTNASSGTHKNLSAEERSQG